MTWQNNLFSNLLVFFIMASLIIIIYCKIKDRTLAEFFLEVKELLSPKEIIE